MALYFDQTGTLGAPSILFLHGIGASSWMWRDQVASLSDFHCITVDLPGHGKSNRVTWSSLADTTDQIAALIESHATNGRAHIVGLSLGGYIAMVLLERHAESIDRVVMSGVTVAPMPNRSLLKPQLWVMGNLLKRRWFVNMQAKSMKLPDDMRKAFTENLLAMSMDAYRRIWEEAVNFHVPSALQHVHNPTLITAGGNESKIIIEAVTAITELMPHAAGCLAPGLGHGWNVEAPDLFTGMVRAWVSDAPLPANLMQI